MKNRVKVLLSSPAVLVVVLALVAMLGASGGAAYAAPCCQECDAQVSACEEDCRTTCGTNQSCLNSCYLTCSQNNWDCLEHCVFCSTSAMAGTCGESRDAAGACVAAQAAPACVGHE